MKKVFKQNYKFIIGLIILILLLTIKFPYYIDAPGGISDVSSKIDIEGFSSKGSFNLAYVKEYNATIPTLFISLINKDWNVLKSDEVLLDNETNENYQNRDKIFMQESISNAIYVAYTNASKEIEIISNKLYITYVLDNFNTDLVTGDQILSINNKKINSKQELLDIIQSSKIGDKLEIKVINNKKEYDRFAYIKEEDNKKVIGILLSNINKYKTTPIVSVTSDSNESGSSGGLITALSIYNSLVKEDITHGLTIVGTGTIDLEGNVGSIGGVEYKLKSAVKSGADLFIVPNDENYNEAIKLKKDNNYDIKIVGVSTFKEAIDYLNNL